MSKPQSDAFLVGSKSDPSRAEPVGAEEYKQLCAALEGTVMAILTSAATDLVTKRFQIIKLDVWGSTACLVVRHRQMNVEGWLYFRVQTSFAPLLSSERIFWMLSIRRDETLEATPGRLRDLQDVAAIQTIVNQFVQQCAAAVQAWRFEPGTSY